MGTCYGGHVIRDILSSTWYGDMLRRTCYRGHGMGTCYR